MSEKIDPTWLAYALKVPAAPERLGHAVRRLRDHYSTLVDYELEVERRLETRTGLISIAAADPVVGWPAFAANERLASAFAYPMTGWRQALGTGSLEDAPTRLAEALLDDPELLANRMPAPAVVGVLEPATGRLVIANDFVGAGRLYVHRFEGGTVWSNRAAAPFLFRGVEPKPDGDGWRVLGAAAWFVGDSTPFEGLVKARPGAIFVADGGEVSSRVSGAVGRVITERAGGLRALAKVASERSLRQVEDAAELWPGRLDVDLSGGRDSRVVSAAVIRAGLDARFITSDTHPGEADIARKLAGAAPIRMEHEIRKGEDYEPEPHADPPTVRALNCHLLHDGMRHPQKVRGKMTLPRTKPKRASLSGHGGDLGHGWLYKSRREALRLRLGGDTALEDRIVRLFAKGHGVGHPESYDLARAEVERIVAEARALGLDSTRPLEYFYIVDRATNRSGIAAHAERVSTFGTQEFVAAGFALRPGQRVDSKLHRLMVGELLPEWSDVPFYKAPPPAERRVRRLHLWEAPADAAEVDTILAEDGAWTEMYRPEKARATWRKLKTGAGRANREQIFEGIVYRHAFDDYLTILRERTRAGEPLLPAR